MANEVTRAQTCDWVAGEMRRSSCRRRVVRSIAGRRRDPSAGGGGGGGPSDTEAKEADGDSDGGILDSIYLLVDDNE